MATVRRRPTTRSSAAAESSSSSDKSIPSSAPPKKMISLGLRSSVLKRKPGEESAAQWKRVRAHRLDAKFVRARASSDADTAGEEDVTVNPAVLEAMNHGPFTSPLRSAGPRKGKAVVHPRPNQTIAVADTVNNKPVASLSPPAKPRNKVAVGLPRSDNNARNAEPLRRGRSASSKPPLAVIPESPQATERGRVLPSVERYESDDSDKEGETAEESAPPSESEDDYEDDGQEQAESSEVESPETSTRAMLRSPQNDGGSTNAGTADRGGLRGSNVGGEDFGYSPSPSRAPSSRAPPSRAPRQNPPSSGGSSSRTPTPDIPAFSDQPFVAYDEGSSDDTDCSAEQSLSENSSTEDPQLPFTAAIPTQRVRDLAKRMGGAGFTNHGNDWRRSISQGNAGLTRNGEMLSHHLSRFCDRIYKAPKAVGNERGHLREQQSFFRRQADNLDKHVEAVSDLVKQIRAKDLCLLRPYYTPDARELSQRRHMVGDLRKSVIPHLVRIIWALFSLGGVNPKDHQQLLDKVLITPIMLEYLRQVWDWTDKLFSKLKEELEKRPLPNEGISRHQLKALVKQRNNDWELFELALRQLDTEDLNVAKELIEAAEEAEQQRIYIERCKQNDERIREERRRQEEQDARRKREQYRIFVNSTQQCGTGPRQTAVPFPGPQAGPDHKPWRWGEKEWLLQEISYAPEGLWIERTIADFNGYASELGKPLSETLKEAAHLQRTARRMSRDQGIDAPAWAQVEDFDSAFHI